MEILSKEQKEMLDFVKLFKDDYILVGGTAIALQIGHRKSIDFNFFAMKRNKLNLTKISHLLSRQKKMNMITTFKCDYQWNLKINGVTVTFYAYPYDIPKGPKSAYFALPSLLDLAAMKAFAIGQRAKWKDYVDISLLIHDFGIETIAKRAKELFEGMFNIRLFESQITYFNDIDYSQEVEYMPGHEKDSDQIKKYLEKTVIEDINKGLIN